MLYRAYSNPMDLMSMYINRGRFGAFVEGFLKLEFERKKEEAEKNNEWMAWVAYVHSSTDKSFNDWMKQFTNTDSTTVKRKSDAALDDAGVSSIINKVFGD